MPWYNALVWCTPHGKYTRNIISQCFSGQPEKGHQTTARERLWGYDLPAQLIYNLHLLQQVEGAHKKPGASRGHQMHGQVDNMENNTRGLHWVQKSCNWGYWSCTLRTDKESIPCSFLFSVTVDFWWNPWSQKWKEATFLKRRLRPPKGPKTWTAALLPLQEPFKWTQDVTDGHTYRTRFRYETY